MKTFADKVIEYNRKLNFNTTLPEEFKILNPFRENPGITEITETFYKKYYNDQNPRKLLLGINPGRFGAGRTGIPFTDTKHLKDYLKLSYEGKGTSEPSSIFIYDMIEAYGGIKAFYQDIYINSIFPLAIVRKNDKGNFINCNYYDYKVLIEGLTQAMIHHLKLQIKFGLKTEVIYIFGKKNAQIFQKITKDQPLFKKVEIFEHPRFIQQYRYHQRKEYALDFIRRLKQN